MSVVIVPTSTFDAGGEEKKRRPRSTLPIKLLMQFVTLQPDCRSPMCTLLKKMQVFKCSTCSACNLPHQLCYDFIVTTILQHRMSVYLMKHTLDPTLSCSSNNNNNQQ